MKKTLFWATFVLLGAGFSAPARAQGGEAEAAQGGEAEASMSLSGAGMSAEGDASAEGEGAGEGEGYMDRYRPEAGLVEIGLFGGVLLPSEDHNWHNESKTHQAYKTVVPEVGLRVGYYPLAFLGLEAEGMFGFGQTKAGDSATLWAGRGHLIAQLTGSSIVPFILAGGGALGVSGDVTGEDVDPVLHFGLGVKVPFGKALGIRLDLRDNLGSKSGDTDAFTNNFEGLLGLTLTLGRSEPEPPLDSDGDGLVNAQDACPMEPAQTPDGCPIRDTDGDGVLDPQDKCPQEPAQTPDGCPIRDTDGDGVLDPQDKCPNEPAATPDGCPVRDTDGDGMLPPDDKCPEQPETANGFEDADGCPDEIPEAVKQFTGVVEGIEFDTGKATIRATSKAVLDKAVQVLKDYPSLRMAISGHTDNVGTDEKNQTLSQARADAVKQYLTEAGIDASRLESSGYGPSQPIAPNDTRDGRQKNRRIEFKILQ